LTAVFMRDLTIVVGCSSIVRFAAMLEPTFQLEQ
jgi:hypothetical protein